MFDHVNVFQSIGESTYNAFTATFSKRMTSGWQAQATYTFAHGEDNAPLTGTYVVGSGDDRVSDPSNLDRDLGVTPFHQAHTFVVSTVIAPSFTGDGLKTALLNNNQIGLIMQANSGLPFNIRSNLDLNRDGQTNDRPLGIDRNTGRLGQVVYLDLRYSRFIPLRERAADRALLRSEESFQYRECRRREPHRDHRCRRQSLGAAARSLPTHERLRSAADAAGGEVCVLTDVTVVTVDCRQSGVGSHSRQSESTVRVAQFESCTRTPFVGTQTLSPDSRLTTWTLTVDWD